MHAEAAMDTIENRTSDEIQVGDSASLVRTLTPQDVKLFAVMSGTSTSPT
jgi:phosphate acetyltransferase